MRACFAAGTRHGLCPATRTREYCRRPPLRHQGSPWPVPPSRHRGHRPLAGAQRPVNDHRARPGHFAYHFLHHLAEPPHALLRWGHARALCAALVASQARPAPGPLARAAAILWIAPRTATGTRLQLRNYAQQRHQILDGGLRIQCDRSTTRRHGQKLGLSPSGPNWRSNSCDNRSQSSRFRIRRHQRQVGAFDLNEAGALAGEEPALEQRHAKRRCGRG